MTKDGTCTELLKEIKPKAFCAAAAAGIDFSKFTLKNRQASREQGKMVRTSARTSATTQADLEAILDTSMDRDSPL